MRTNLSNPIVAAVAAACCAGAVVSQSGKRAELVPAGSINSVSVRRPIVFVVQDEQAILGYVTALRDRWFKGAKIVKDKDAVKQNLSGSTLLVYGTPTGNAWLAKHEARLPFRFGKRRVEVGRTFEGGRLRVICTMRNPDNRDQRVVIYTAAASGDVVGLNSLFHGPTEWVVADGNRTLASGNWEPSRDLTPQEMGHDLDYLIKIEQDHPATANGVSARLKQAFASARNAVTKPMSRTAFWLVANSVLMALDDAHSSLGRQATGERIDLPFVWLPDGIVVSDDTAELDKGDRVLTIGGHDETELLAALRRVVPAENDGWIKCVGQRTLQDLALLKTLGITTEATVRVEVDHNGKRKAVVLGATSRPSARGARRPWVRWKIHEKASLGVLTLDACHVNDTYRRALPGFFEAVHDKKVRRIAVDVRHNGGGDSRVLDEFLRYVDVDSYESYSGEVRESADSLAQRRSGGQPGYHRYGRTKKTNEKRTGIPLFDGKLYVLTSNATFSSANWFAVVLQDDRLAEVVGEATGNAPSCYGDILTFTLPESCYSFTLSFKKWIRPDPSKDPADRLVPDHVIPLTRKDVIASRDPVLEFLLRDRKRKN